MNTNESWIMTATQIGWESHRPRFRHEAHLPNDTAAGMRLLERIVTELHAAGFTRRDIGAIELAVTESLVNAVGHGNGNDPGRRVRVAYSIEDAEFAIQIEDEGEGFVRQDIPDPTLVENLWRPCGRGLLLMRSLMNEVEFNETGNRVTLRKTLTRRETEYAPELSVQILPLLRKGA